MKIKVGNREQIGVASLLVPPGEDAWIEFTADTWNVRVHVVFIDTEDREQGFMLQGEEEHATISIKNWTNSLPSALEVPFLLGTTNGREILFSFTGYAVGGCKRIDFSFFWGSENGN